MARTGLSQQEILQVIQQLEAIRISANENSTVITGLDVVRAVAQQLGLDDLSLESMTQSSSEINSLTPRQLFRY